MQAEAGKAEIDRQRPVDLVAAVVEQLRAGRATGVGTPSRITFTVTGRVVEEAEVEQLHPERAAAAAEQRPVGPEADVAVGVEVEPVERLGQRREVAPRRDRRRARGRGAPRPRSGRASAPAAGAGSGPPLAPRRGPPMRVRTTAAGQSGIGRDLGMKDADTATARTVKRGGLGASSCRAAAGEAAESPSAERLRRMPQKPLSSEMRQKSPCDRGRIARI